MLFSRTTLLNVMMPVQTAWICIPAHREAEGATATSEHLQDSMNAASHPNIDLQQMEKTILKLDQMKVIASMKNHSIIISHETGK